MAKIDKETGEELINKKGQEIVDPTPIKIPVRLKRPMSIHDQVREALRSEHLARLAEAHGAETPEEADDFDIPDGFPQSPYEENFDHVSNYQTALKNSKKPRPKPKKEEKKEEEITTPPIKPDDKK